MPAAKRSCKSGARVSTQRGKSSKANVDSAMTNGNHFVSDDESVAQETRVAKRAKPNHKSEYSERWTPYFKSKRLQALDATQLVAAGDEPAGDSTGLETADMQECQSMRRALILVIGPDPDKPLPLKKLRAEFDTGADDCLITQSCYQRLEKLLEFKTGEIVIAGATKGVKRLTRYVELNLNIGSINFPPGIKFWVDGALPADAGFDILIGGPFLVHHNVICINPRVQREIEKDGEVELKIQRHFDFLAAVNRPLTKQEIKTRIHKFS